MLNCDDIESNDKSAFHEDSEKEFLSEFEQSLKEMNEKRKQRDDKISFIPTNVWKKELFGDIDNLTEF